MDLRQIRYFAVVARQGSFVAASRVLNISQPALGQQVRNLEAELGAPLLVRHGRGVDLTPAGEVFLAHAESLLAQAAAAERAMQPFRAPSPRRLTLGVTPSAGRALAPDLLAACAAHPQLQLSVRHGLTDDSLRQLAAGQMDMALCYEAVSSGLSEPLYSEDFCLVGPASSLDGYEDGEIAFSALAGRPLILDAAVRRLVEGVARRQGMTLDIAGEVEPVDAKRDMLFRNHCCSVVSRDLFADDVSAGRMLALTIVRPSLPRTLYFNAGPDAPAEDTALVLSLIRPLAKAVIESARRGWRAPV